MRLERAILSQHTQVESLLEREAEIERYFSDFQELQQVLPKLSDLLTQKRKLSKKIMSVKQLEQEKLLAQKLQEGAEQRRDAREHEAKHYKQAYDDLRNQRDQLLTCKEILAPLVIRLKRLEEIQERIEHITSELEKLPAATHNFCHTSQEYNLWKRLNDYKNFVVEELQRQEATLDIEAARQAQDKQNAIEQQLADLEKELGQQKRLYEQEKTLTQQANEVFKQLFLCFQVCSKRLETERKKEAAIARHLQSTLDSIPRRWLERAQGLDADDLEALKHKRDKLAKYEGLHKQLAPIKRSTEHVN